MDDLDSMFIYELQLQDVEELISGGGGKGSTVAQPLALESSLLVQKLEIEGALRMVRDMQMSKSIARAVLQDVSPYF